MAEEDHHADLVGELHQHLVAGNGSFQGLHAAGRVGNEGGSGPPVDPRRAAAAAAAVGVELPQVRASRRRGTAPVELEQGVGCGNQNN